MVSTMTSRQRIRAALRRQPVDHAPMMLWGLDPIQRMPDASYQPLHDYILAHGDIKYRWKPGGPPCFQEYNASPVEVKAVSWTEGATLVTRTTVHTPLGDLEEITQTVPDTIITATRKRFITGLDDLRKWMSLPYTPYRPEVDSFFAAEALVGERGAITYRLSEPSFLVRDLFEPEAFALACLEDRSAIHAATEAMCQRLLDHLRHILQAGARPIFIIQGCESATPPMQSPAHFDEFVVRYEKPLLELIKSYGCLAIVHCHGNLSAVLERFVDLGYDGLHPVEEPPMGDITLAEFKRRVGQHLSVVGNIQIGEMLSASPDEVEALTRHALEDGGPIGLLLSPTATPYERPMSERTFANYRRLIDIVVRG